MLRQKRMVEKKKNTPVLMGVDFSSTFGGLIKYLIKCTGPWSLIEELPDLEGEV